MASWWLREGVFFVLGNHDFRQRQLKEFRGALVKEGLIDLEIGPRLPGS